MVVYNDHPLRRINLCVRMSDDGCRTWGPPRRIAPVGDDAEEAEAAYPNACQLADGTIVVVFYQVTRKHDGGPYSILGVRFSPDMLAASSER